VDGNTCLDMVLELSCLGFVNSEVCFGRAQLRTLPGSTASFEVFYFLWHTSGQCWRDFFLPFITGNQVY